MKLKNILTILSVAALLLPVIFSHSCANTTQAPSGGKKDTIPPRLVAVRPYPGDINVPVIRTQVVFTFNEYVSIKDAKSLSVSPPTAKPPKSKISGKSLVLTFEDTLQLNTTYCIDITGVVADNNEGNMFEGYNLVFSTGERIDSMYVTGLVQDCSTLQPLKGALVLMYKDMADSAVFKHRPDAAAKADDWGFFCIRNIQDTAYRMYAITDANSNSMYDPLTETVAFVDTVLRPTHRVKDGIYELYKFDMKDTAACLARKTDYELNLFKETPHEQKIVNYVRTGDRSAYVTFQAPRARVDSIWFRGKSPSKVLTQFNIDRDSLLIWLNDPAPQADTLFLRLKYWRTDTTGKMRRKIAKIKLSMPSDKKTPALKSMQKKNLKHDDTIAVFTVDAKPENFEQSGIRIAFNYPLAEGDFNKLKYTVTNPRQQTSNGKYKWERDTTDLRAIILRHNGKILPGYEYKLTVPYRMFRDINGYWNDSTAVSVKLPDDDNLSKLSTVISGVEDKQYIVDLMDEKRSTVLRSYTITSDSTLEFPYLKEGNYCIRITEDVNFNGQVDTGNLLAHIQPEKVRFFKLKNGGLFLAIPAASEVEQDINLKQMFK